MDWLPVVIAVVVSFVAGGAVMFTLVNRRIERLLKASPPIAPPPPPAPIPAPPPPAGDLLAPAPLLLTPAEPTAPMPAVAMPTPPQGGYWSPPAADAAPKPVELKPDVLALIGGAIDAAIKPMQPPIKPLSSGPSYASEVIDPSLEAQRHEGMLLDEGLVLRGAEEVTQLDPDPELLARLERSAEGMSTGPRPFLEAPTEEHARIEEPSLPRRTPEGDVVRGRDANTKVIHIEGFGERPGALSDAGWGLDVVPDPAETPKKR